MIDPKRVEEARRLLQERGLASQPSTSPVDIGAEVRAQAQNAGLLKPSQPVSQPQRSRSAVKDVAVGAGKGAISTVRGLANVGGAILNKLNPVARKISGALGAKGQVAGYSDIVPKAMITPTNTAQKVGFAGEQIAEFFLPTSGLSKISKTVDVLADGLRLSGKLGKAAKLGLKVAGRAVPEAVTTGGIRYVQTQNAKEATTAGLTAGGISGTLKAGGEALRMANVPEWIYSKVFKTSYDDMLDELKTAGTQNLAKNDPVRFKQLQQAGIIKTTKSGEVVVNDTLAKEALNKGLKGSLRNMANQVVKNLYDAEDSARYLTKNYAGKIKLEEQYGKLLNEVADDYANVGFGEVSQEARSILAGISQGSTTADNALKLRRFLDGMRIRSAFNPANKLTQTQQNFKTLADTLRGRLSTEVPGLKSVMNDYRFSIEALESIAKEAARRNNREALGLLDTVLFGSGVAAGSPVAGATIGTARKVLTSPSALTNIASKIQKGSSSRLGAGIRGSIGAGVSATLNSQQPPDR